MVRWLHRLDRRPGLWLLLGVLLLATTEVRAGIGMLAWIAPLPWLRYLRLTTGVRSRLAFAGVGAIVSFVAASLESALADREHRRALVREHALIEIGVHAVHVDAVGAERREPSRGMGPSRRSRASCETDPSGTPRS